MVLSTAFTDSSAPLVLQMEAPKNHCLKRLVASLKCLFVWPDCTICLCFIYLCSSVYWKGVEREKSFSQGGGEGSFVYVSLTAIGGI